jgi:hypothetical protein
LFFFWLAPSFLISIRFLLAIIAFSAYAIQYTQKINMSVAIVCMINNTALEERKHASALELTTTTTALPETTTSAIAAEAHPHDSCSGSYHGKKSKMV